MKKIKSLLALSLTAVILTGCTNVREIGIVNGTHLTRVTARGVFSPSSTTILAHEEGSPGVEVLANATGPGLVPAVATAGGIAGGAALLRPARTSVSNSSDNRSNSNSSNENVPTVPPARNHPDSPGNGGTPGNGGVNNPNN